MALIKVTKEKTVVIKVTESLKQELDKVRSGNQLNNYTDAIKFLVTNGNQEVTRTHTDDLDGNHKIMLHTH